MYNVAKSILRPLRNLVLRFLGIEERLRIHYFNGNRKLASNVQFKKPRVFMHFLTHNIEFVRFEEPDRVYFRKDGITVITDKYLWIFREVFCDELNYIPPYLLPEEYVVFDFGMNRGYATLYFLSLPSCQHVYGFEPVKSTFRYALENFAQNPHVKSKISAFNVGVGSKDVEVKAYVHKDRDGISSFSEEFIDSCVPETRESAEIEVCTLKQASRTMRNLIDSDNISVPIVIKTDIEGLEYEVFEDLLMSKDVMQHVDIIIGEYHLGLDRLRSPLEKAGFVLYSSSKSALEGEGRFLFIKELSDAQKSHIDKTLSLL